MTRNSFDVVRLAAALLVVYGHAFPLTGNAAPGFAGNSVQAIAVKVFFVISGYLIMASWQRDPSAVRFLIRRALRIMPGLIAVVVFTTAILGPLLSTLGLQEYLASGRTWTYLHNALLRPQYDLPGVFTANVYPVAVNGSLWSLPAEVAMYVAGPVAWLAGMLVLRNPRAGYTLFTVAALIGSLYLVRYSPPAVPPVIYGSSLVSLLDVAPYFLVGGLFSLWHLDRFFNPLAAACAWVALSLLHLPGMAMEIGLYAVLPFVVLTIATHPSHAGDWLSKRGDISYGVYLYGFPVQQCVVAVLGASAYHPLANFFLTLIPLVLISALSWRFVEQPMLRFKPTKAVSATSLSKQGFRHL